MEKILDRFLRYVAVDTKADPESETQPSAARELDLLKMLRDELVEMGVEATLDQWGYDGKHSVKLRKGCACCRFHSPCRYST